MVEVLFFARIREQLGVDRLSLALPSAPINLQQFKQYLIENNDPSWAEVLLADNVVKAVNQEVVDDNHCLSEGDEIAFFPPVTGG
ncbi:MAG TPA: molybdopterin converting factor subunit 1 [Porticoccus sp.]|nr:molybdopterin converting factor subunit 1 [Porticoccus sp.]